jgi:uncharacterized metal-binding protein YceD (DUF177 family)
MEKNEFYRPFPVDKLRAHPMQERIEANEKECEALAERLNIVALKSLQVDMTLQRVIQGGVVEVEGRIKADVVQTCVVTLEPFESHLEEDFKTYFARPDQIPDPTEEAVEDEQAPEPIAPNGEIDLGELTAQHLSLALDPHPRKPGAVFIPPPGIEEIKVEKKNPFAILEEYRNKKDDKKK